MRARSQALIANAAHHRADSLSSLVAAVGIGGAVAGVPVLDPLAAMGIAAMIGKLGLDVGLGAVKELVDTRLDDALLKQVEDMAGAGSRAGDIRGVRRLRARRMGPSVLLDMEIGVGPRMSVAAAAAVADELRAAIFAARPEVTEALVSTFPLAGDAGDVQSGGGVGAGGASAGVEGSGGGGGSAVAAVEVRGALRGVLAATSGVRAVSACEVVVVGGGGGGGDVGSPGAAQPVPPSLLLVDVRARVVCDMALPLRDAATVVRRAKQRLLDAGPAGGADGGGQWRVADADVTLETNPV
jgi:hypothetical protein